MRKLSTRQRIYLPFKRFFDIVFSLVMLIALSPLFLAAAVIIKLDSPGPVIYKHKRLGINGRLFDLYKFRTMVQDAEDLNKYLTPGAQLEFRLEYKLKDDPRITRAGQRLRKLKIDELPQFVNVLKGDLSVVGPRPVVEEEILKYGHSKDDLLSVMPGITGYWQVNARGDYSYTQRIAMELHYVKTFSFAGDILIFFKTFGAILRGKGTYEARIIIL